MSHRHFDEKRGRARAGTDANVMTSPTEQQGQVDQSAELSAALAEAMIHTKSDEAKPVSTTDQVVTPHHVQGAMGKDGRPVQIDYDRLITQFGTQRIDDPLLARLERLTKRPAHPFLRRGLFFSHRDMHGILDRYERGEPFYLYTGRGPSSGSMHLGHMIPFLFCRYLQEVFDVPLVVQLTDDEKFLFNTQLTLAEVQGFARDNARDIMAFGFHPDKTYIFSNLSAMSPAFYQNVVRISRCITGSVSRATFGFTDSDNIGKLHFVAVQAAPAFSHTFPHLFGARTDIPCLIPCAIDQDPYFRLTRDVAARLGYPKPALLHAQFTPALQGPGSKMSASDPLSAVFLTDTPAQIKRKIHTHAFSGGGDTLALHRAHGGNPDVDVAFQYLRFFLEDDAELADMEARYRAGDLLTGHLKARCVAVLQAVVRQVQEARAALTDATVDRFMTAHD